MRRGLRGISAAADARRKVTGQERWFLCTPRKLHCRTNDEVIMEPGWIVLLFSLFVQMFFTVLASRPRLRLGVWARNRATRHVLQPVHAPLRHSWLRLCRPTRCAAFSWKRSSHSPRSRGSSTRCGARSHSTYSTSGTASPPLTPPRPAAGSPSRLQPAAGPRPAQKSPLLTPRSIYGARRYTIEGLMHMGRDLGILSPVAYAITCEAKQDMFRQERNAG